MSCSANGVVLRSIRPTSCLRNGNFFSKGIIFPSLSIRSSAQRSETCIFSRIRISPYFFSSITINRQWQHDRLSSRLIDLQRLYREAIARVIPSPIIAASQAPPRPSRPTIRYVRGEIPPEEKKAPSPNSLPHTGLLYTILGINTVVFLGWQYAHDSAQKHKDPRPYFFMYKNFLAGSYNLHEGRWWTLFTSSISHETFDHFVLNMLSLAFMTPPILAIVGPITFLGLYFGAGFGCSLASIGWNKYVTPVLHKEVTAQRNDPNQYLQTSHGASGSIFAVMTTFALLSPHTTFLIFFVIPVPAWLAVSGLFTYDFLSALTRPDRRIDSAGHIGGVMSGYAFWRYVLLGLRFR